MAKKNKTIVKKGRKPLPESEKRKGVFIKLPPRIIEFIKAQEDSQSNVIIDALTIVHKELRN